ncbi:hypothetical protein [Paraburkholderia caffeinilytica]|uniref:hypothetical protein n=1 Tax=Paraburkholderia caffeinilytica TaxID=1761016 RepID=UPI0013BEA41A|nr:hypothetical protein [Paraburkholderia caffeinilytica]
MSKPVGRETLEMVQRYAHLSADHLARRIQPHTGRRPTDGRRLTVFSLYWEETKKQRNR